jgi:hypothetical protein
MWRHTQGRLRRFSIILFSGGSPPGLHLSSPRTTGGGHHLLFLFSAVFQQVEQARVRRLLDPDKPL